MKMKNHTWMAARRICILCSLMASLTAVAAHTDTVYVSATGNPAQADGTRTHPHASLQEAISRHATTGPATDTLCILVAPGDYYMDRPILIDPSVARPLTIRAQDTRKPRLIGGLRVDGWTPCEEDGLYRAYVPEVKHYGMRFEQFYVNGKRAIPARTPNDKWLFVKSTRETPFAKGTRKPAYAVQQINFDEADWRTLLGVSPDWLEGMTIRFYHKWDITRKVPAHIEADSARVWIEGEGMQPWNVITKGSRYVLYGYRAALDAPGEWWLDKKEGYLYYRPRTGEQMNEAECIIPALHQWLVVKGSPERPVRHLRLEGLSFCYASYLLPDGGEEPMQAAAFTEAAVQMDYAEDCILHDCELLHTGSYAIWLRQGCHRNHITHCYMADLGSGGIKVGEPWWRASERKVTSGTVIDNNIITDTGHELPCGVGVALFHTSHNQVTHNEISHLLYSAVSVGWYWGYNNPNPQPVAALTDDNRPVTVKRPLVSPATHNLILYNHLHHIGAGELSDMGAVYTLGESEGTRVSYNVIHDVWSYDYGGWGLYTDEGSTGVEMSHNLVYRCKSGAFHQHYGKENRIEHNILAFSHVHQVQLSRSEPHLSFHFRHNIILFDRGEVLAGAWNKAKTDMDYNLYWNTAGDMPQVMGKPFAEWKKLHEPHSVCADPMFVDAKADNYTFASKRAAKRIRFEATDFSQAGVYGSDEWRRKAAQEP